MRETLCEIAVSTGVERHGCRERAILTGRYVGTVPLGTQNELLVFPLLKFVTSGLNKILSKLQVEGES